MRAITVMPGMPGTGELTEVDEPEAADGPVLLETLAVGVCRTDIAIVSGNYGWPPSEAVRLVIGHESLGRVVEAPGDNGLSPGDLAVGVVRGRDPRPCVPCAAGREDLCRNDGFTERGIKRRHGFAVQRFRCHPSELVLLERHLGVTGVLLEPTSLVAKAWEQIDLIARARWAWSPRRVLVTGAGPVGLLASLLGRQRNLEVHVLDQVTAGLKPQLVAELGATYHTSAATVSGAELEVLLDCTGVGRLVIEAMDALVPDAVVCMTGVSSGTRSLDLTPHGPNDRLAFHDRVLLATVSSARRHYEAAAQALAAADQDWLSRLITRRVDVEHWSEAFEGKACDLKVVIDFTAPPETPLTRAGSIRATSLP